MTYEKFEEFLLPGNYALTKSMEMVKIDYSGTLWYTKKYLVWYYFIFLSNELDTRSYIFKIKEIFEIYVNSISEEDVREEARKYFFPEEQAINITSQNFKTFEKFKGNIEFANKKEKNKYENEAKNFYMALMLGSGGQSGVNAYIKEKMYEKDFNMSKLDDTIKGYKDYNGKLTDIKRDYHAFVRNERQILFYYGYFHSKSVKSLGKEFSSLTPVGELALYANFDEFLCIWEHQKIKMISQPLTVKINNIPKKYSDKADTYFGISFSPYLDILRYLRDYNKITIEEYKYIVSRNKNQIYIEKWKENKEIIDNIEKIKNIVESFGRTADKRNEDSSKELIKYLLGIIDLPKDKGSNKFGFLTKDYTLKKETKEKFKKMLSEYEKLEKYKKRRYVEIFKKSEKELKEKYKCKNYKINLRNEAAWKLYLIRPEKTILLGIMKVVDENLDILFEKYKNILIGLGIKNKIKLNEEINRYKEIVEENKEIIEEAYDEKIEIYQIRKESAADLFNKIVENSNIIEFGIERKRNMTLINLMKNYYIQTFISENKLLKCECCGKTTFITTRNIPYLEYHHLIPFGGGNNGPDHYLNIFAICPECHRKMHFLNLDEKERLYNGLSINNYLDIKIIDRLKELKKGNILKSYQVEFLMCENAITEAEYNELLN